MNTKPQKAYAFCGIFCIYYSAGQGIIGVIGSLVSARGEKQVEIVHLDNKREYLYANSMFNLDVL